MNTPHKLLPVYINCAVVRWQINASHGCALRGLFIIVHIDSVDITGVSRDDIRSSSGDCSHTSLAKIDSKNAVIIFRTVAKRTRRGASEYKYNRFVLRTLNGVYSPVVGSCDNKLPRRVALEWLERSSLSQIPCDSMRLPLDSAKARRWSLLLSPSLSLSLSRCV